MGEVYRAKDTRLDRTVAIKVLPAHFSANPDLKQRFEREARAISSLSHPYICALHDIGSHDGIDFMVMEFLEGETLAQRLHKGALTVEQSLRYGIQIAEALDKAHKQGIIHRDLKPGNIMITKSGVKLLDFGLAKFGGQGLPLSGREDVSTLPPEQRELTAEGTILGTVQYMSPEQLEGRDCDLRTDIFSLGTVLYEMVTGKHAFTGKSQASLIAAILSSHPHPISTIQPVTPPALDWVVKTCMAKDPDDRWETAHDIVLQLRWISEVGLVQPVPFMQKRTKRFERAFWMVAVLILTGLLLFLNYQRATDVSVIRFMVPPPAGSSFDNTIALSPNGETLVFTASDLTGNNILWLRSLDSSHPRGLQGTEGAAFPFWAPDSKSIGYFSEGNLKKFDLASGSSQTICRAPNPRGGTMNLDGVILFSAHEGGAIYRVSSKGGNPALQVSLDATQGESTVRYPSFLPDGRHFLYYVWSMNPKMAGIYIGSLDSKEKQWLINADSGAVYTSGYLIFLLSGNQLMAHAFDPDNLKLKGDPVKLVESAWVKWFTAGFAAFSVAQNGVLAYRTGGFENSEFIWYDRTGKQIGKAGPPGLYAEPCLSPDEKKISFSGRRGSSNLDSDIWILELTRGIANRVPNRNRGGITSLWSPDGSRMVYASYPEGVFSEANLSSGKVITLLKLTGFAATDDWSRDGRFLVYTTLELKTNQSDIWMLPINSNGKPVPFLTSEYNEDFGQVSPDGNWIAYSSDESGRYEVYVQNFPTPGGKVQISTTGGQQQKWSANSKEIFYISPDRKMMSVDFHPGSTEQPAPKILFQTKIMPKIEARNHYVVTGDGQRFLINTPLEEIATSPIEVVLNWTSLLQ